MTKCQICSNTNTKFFHKLKQYSYFFCDRCVTLYLWPQPPDVEITKYYSKSFNYSAGAANEKLIHSRARLILNHLKQYNPAGHTLLDIGSGYGYFLEETDKSGLKPVGVEPSKQLFLQSINRLDFPIYNLTFKEFLSKNKKKYDFITLIHTIEHVLQPKDIITDALNLLNKDGILFIETPNLDSHLFYAEKYDYTFLTPPDHLWLFSPKSFKYMLQSLKNIGIERISTYSYPQHLMGIMKKIIDPNVILESRQRRDDRILKNPISRSKNHHSFPDDNALKKIKYLFFDQLLAPLLTPLLNIGGKGSILELYIKKI